jgi:hypothetical protein
MGLGRRVAEEAPAEVAAFFLELSGSGTPPPDLMPLAARAMVVRGGLPNVPSECGQLGGQLPVFPDPGPLPALLVSIPGAWTS